MSLCKIIFSASPILTRLWPIEKLMGMLWQGNIDTDYNKFGVKKKVRIVFTALLGIFLVNLLGKVVNWVLSPLFLLPLSYLFGYAVGLFADVYFFPREREIEQKRQNNKYFNLKTIDFFQELLLGPLVLGIAKTIVFLSSFLTVP